MSVRAIGRPGPVRLDRLAQRGRRGAPVAGRVRRVAPIGRRAVGVAGRLALIVGLVGVLAGPVAALASAAGAVTVTTPFPAVVVEPGTTASFKLSLAVTSPQRVDLKATGVPGGWTARFRGGGLVVDGVYADGKTAPELTFDVEVPEGTASGTSTIRLEATGGGTTDSLPLTLRVADAAAGSVRLTSDFPELRGPSSGAFTFNVTIHNETAAEGQFAMDATGPDGWTVSAKPSGQSQATSTTVAAGATSTVTVTATPPQDVAAGTFPIKVTVTGAGKTATADLKVSVTGSYTLKVSTPDEVLSTTANAGSRKDLQLTLTNSGTAPVTEAKMTSTAPTNWKVTFDPEVVPIVEPGKAATVTAQITPTNDAIAGDYEVTMTATGAEANNSATIRVRVDTPQFWWIVGIVLIVLTFAALYWVFRTYGRR